MQQETSLPRSSGQYVRFKAAESVALLELNDPSHFNALSAEMASDMHAAVNWLAAQKGDLISVPANTRHWFDMGPNPNFIAIRMFNNPDGWVANFTGDHISTHFNRLDN